jgi:hypothetical protein
VLSLEVFVPPPDRSVVPSDYPIQLPQEVSRGILRNRCWGQLSKFQLIRKRISDDLISETMRCVIA